MKIQYCQHSTWQGSIIWADEEKAANFRSAMEMMLLIDEALQSTGDAPERAKWKEMPEMKPPEPQKNDKKPRK